MAGVGLRVTTDAEAGLVMVEVAQFLAPERAPVDICAVVDVSGSMGRPANIKDERGSEMNDGLTVLDVVKHGLRTVVYSLGPLDTFSLVSFSTTARVVVQTVALCDAGRESALSGIDSLHADGQTNLWDGIKMGIDALRSAPPRLEGNGKDEKETVPRVSACLLLTDGQPNIVPPSGHIPMLRRSIEESSHVVPVHAFGFGREVESQLLDEIAAETGALYAFIPDASLVGSVFISTLANLVTTLATAATLRVELEEPATAAAAASVSQCGLRGARAARDQRVVDVPLGALHREQPRAVVLAARDVTRVTLRYADVAVTAPPVPAVAEDRARMRAELARQTAAALIRRCLELGTCGKFGEAQAEVRAHVVACAADADAGLLADLQGQVLEAVSDKQQFDRWGRHYLPSLSGAHAYQVSNNCKDTGVQRYGGPVFRKLREAFEDIFLKIPPPVATYVMHARQPPTPVNIAAYIDHSGPCFEGGGMVAMHDGTRKRVDEVRKGDVVLGGRTVVCVVRTDSDRSLTDLTRVGTLLVTDWHPIQHENQWAFPCLVPGATVVHAACDAVYNFVLEAGNAGHELTIEGTACVTLGHGLEGPVVSHAYFGTDRVVDDLRRMRGWSDGLVPLIGTLRGLDGLVCGLVQRRPALVLTELD
jgi:Mg-chelatase subunit ChlD